MDRKIKFTSHALSKLPRPERGKVRYFDTDLSGHCVRVTAQGAITFGIYKRVPLTHRVIDVTIGKWPELSISDSRKIAQDKLYEIAKGINPNEVKRTVKADLTLGELYHSVRDHEFSTIKTLKNYESIFRCHLEKWSTKRLSEITPFSVQTLHVRIGKEIGTHAANRALQLLRSLFSKAKVRGFDKPNPAAGIRQFREKSRDRFVQPDEAKTLFDAVLKEENATMRDFLLLSILTGARRSNVLSMRWEDVDLKERIWKLRETKNGEPQIIPLVPYAVAILSKRTGNSSPWVLDSPLSRSGHLEEVKSGWKRVLTRAGLKDLRLHDLRRTFGSWQAISGSSLHVIGKSLNHKSYEATQIYARLNIDPIRESVERATDSLLVAAGVSNKKPPASVPPFKQSSGPESRHTDDQAEVV
jgi:integrase